MALAEATRGATEWEGLGRLSGSRINDIATALSIFCSQYSTNQWGNLLRQDSELPELTDEDIEWLLVCGLTETMESHEPAVVHVDPGRFALPLTRTRTSKRRCKGKGEGEGRGGKGGGCQGRALTAKSGPCTQEFSFLNF
jgi:hypothetical protein